MKGISEIIATILMLVIVIALGGTAYLYISGTFTRETQVLEFVDSFCNDGKEARILFRNLGTSNITFVAGGTTGTFGDCVPATGSPATCGSISVTRTSGGGTASFDGDRTPVAPGTTANLRDTGCAESGSPITCVYRITPPFGRSVVATVNCLG